MEENSRYAAGIDIGTENARVVVSSVSKDGKISVVGFNEIKNAGMRKGMVANLAGPSESVDRLLGEVERMCGFEIHSAVVSVNGAQILTTRTQGMIAVGAADHEINQDDLFRVEEVATSGRIPANREILGVIPLEYILDEQGGVKDPVGMTGSRLEMKASVISTLSPNCENIRKAMDGAEVKVDGLIPSVVAAARAVLEEKQMENGVAVVDFGAATTSVAIYEEGELQYVGVVPAGSNNVTNDLAIMLEINTDIAEEIKRRYVSGSFDGSKDVTIKVGRDEMVFDREKIDEVVKARLEEIFEKVKKELKRAGYEKRLPEGIVLVGGGAKLKDIDVFAKQALGASVKIGLPKALGGVGNSIEKPEYAVAIGLMIIATEDNGRDGQQRKMKKKGGEGFLSKLFGKFKF